MTERDWLRQLYEEYDALCFHYSLVLRKPLIQIAQTSSVWGSWDPLTRTISIARNLLTSFTWDVVIEVLKHEMAHQYVAEALMDAETGHGAKFQEVCRRLGTEAWASRSEQEMEAGLTSQHRRESANSPAKERIKKLLSLAESDNEHEAALAMTRAQELMVQHNLEGRHDDDYGYRILDQRNKRIPGYLNHMAAILNDHYLVRTLMTNRYCPRDLTSYKVIEVYGKLDNVDTACHVYDYLLQMLPLLWRNYRASANCPGGLGSKNSYYHGVLVGFDQKLRAARSRTQSHNQTPGIVARNSEELLVADLKRLDTAFKRRHPRTRSSSRKGRLSDPNSYKTGLLHGQELNVGRRAKVAAYLKA